MKKVISVSFSIITQFNFKQLEFKFFQIYIHLQFIYLKITFNQSSYPILKNAIHNLFRGTLIMSFINKFGKTTIASSIVAASVLGASNVSHASGSGAGPGENAQGQQGQDDAVAFGNTKNPKNVIFMVGDGMGPSFNTAYRYYKNQPGAKK